MPLEINLYENEIIGPALRQGYQEGSLAIIRRQLKRRFGLLPEWVEDRLKTLSPTELEQVSDRLLEAAHVEYVFDWK